MKTTLKVNRVDRSVLRPIRIGVIRGKREHSIFLSDDDAARLADVLRSAMYATRYGEFGKFEEDY